MKLKNAMGTLAIGLMALTTQKAEAFFGFGDCWDNTDCIWNNIRSWDWGGTVDATGGYRYDEITCLINAYDPPGTFLSSDDLKAKNLSVWEWGLKSRLRLGNFYAKAWGTFGIIPFGNYTETGTSADDISSRTKADVRHGKVTDASFGGGYLFCFGDCFSFAPTVGWSYNYQRIKLKHAHTDGISDPIVNGLAYKNRWQGPWAGFDTVAQISCLAINAGYEYHWAHWHAEWKLAGDNQIGGAFSDRRKSTHASGNVVYLNTYWNAWDDLDAGVLLKYQYWRAKNGRETPIGSTFAELGFGADEEDKVAHAIWQSIEIQLSLGYTF